MQASPCLCCSYIGLNEISDEAHFCILTDKRNATDFNCQKLYQNFRNLLFAILLLVVYHHGVVCNHCNRGTKHDFPFINICKVLKEVVKIEGFALGFFNTSRGTWRMLMNDKIILIAIIA